jgi:DNA primase
MEYAGLSLPNDSYNPNEKIELVASTHPFILRKCLNIFAEELGNTDIGCEVRAYLAQRDYTNTDIDRMRLGALPDLPRLQARLEQELNIEQKFINFFCKSMEHYQHHPLAIPCYGKHGALEGFIFRSIDSGSLPETEDKYKNMSKLNRDASVLNIPRNTKEIVIVEGVLDALLAKARGARNVVSLNGTGLNDAQIDALAELGIERIILCLDNDDAGSDATFRHTKRLLAHEHPFEVYITELPEMIKDIDELIIKHGIEAFYDAIHYSIGMGEYLANELIKAYPKRDVYRPLPAMQRKRLMDAVSPLKLQLKSFEWELRDFLSIVDKYANKQEG